MISWVYSLLLALLCGALALANLLVGGRGHLLVVALLLAAGALNIAVAVMRWRLVHSRRVS